MCQPVWALGPQPHRVLLGEPCGRWAPRKDLGHCSPGACSCRPRARWPVSGCSAWVLGPMRPVQGRELAAGCVRGHRVPFLGPVRLSPEDLPAAPSLPLQRGQTPYLPASEATLVAGGHLLALKPSTPA